MVGQVYRGICAGQWVRILPYLAAINKDVEIIVHRVWSGAIRGTWNYPIRLGADIMRTASDTGQYYQTRQHNNAGSQM
jgi:hypothetical protein